MRLSCQIPLLLLWPLLAAPLPCPGQEALAPDPGTAALIDLLPRLDDASAQLDILKGIRAGLEGQRQVAAPPNWAVIYRDHLAKSSSSEVREIAQLLALQFGDQEVRRALIQLVVDEKAPLPRRREALTALAEIRASELPGELHTLLHGSALRQDALRVLAEFGGDQTPHAIIAAYLKLNLEEKRIAIDALTSNAETAKRLLEAVQHEKIPRTDLGAETIRKLQLLGDASIDEAIAKHWGTTRATPEEKAQRIAALKEMLTSPADHEADLPRGRALFAKTCRQCHTLYGDGEKVGPDITGTNRSDLDYILLNVIDPNSTVGKDYQAWSVLTDAGKLYVGLVVAEDDRVLSLRTETDTLRIPKDEIEYRELTPASMMPEGILDQLSERDIRDLVAYLRSSRQVPLLATEETAAHFFNGRDLGLWSEFGGSWRITGGELHGTQTDETNTFAGLLSEFLLDEFTLKMDIKLTRQGGKARVLLATWLGGSDNGDTASESGEPRIVWIDLRPDGRSNKDTPISAKQQAQPQRGSPDWHSLLVRRSSENLTVAVDGVEILTDTVDAAARLRFAFRLEDGLDGELIVRDVKLVVPIEPTSGTP